MIRHTSGVIVVTSFVPNNLYYTEYSAKEMYIFCMILLSYNYIQFIKNIVYASMMKSCSLSSFSLPSFGWFCRYEQ